MQQTWSLVQPTALRRQWELRHGTEQKALLRIPGFRAGAQGQTPEGRLRIEQRGRVSHNYAVLDGSGKEVALLETDGRRRVLRLDRLSADWKRLGHKEGSGFVGADGQPLLSARVRTGLLRSTGEVQIHGLDDRQAIVAALLACYLLIRRNEQDAASAAASTTVASS